MKYNKTHTCSICSKDFIAKNWRADVCSHECHLKRRRNWHIKNGDSIREKERARYRSFRKPYYGLYEKTINGLLMRKYRNMKSRVFGIQKKKSHLYLGKELLPKEEFYNWAKSCKDFHALYKEWVKNNYERKLTPSVDRIDPKIGYIISNMRWLTHSENSRLTSKNKTH